MNTTTDTARDRYNALLNRRRQFGDDTGFEPIWMPDNLFSFQKSLVEWSCLKGRAAIFADCGMGKTAMQLTWAQNVVQKTNRPVLILTPLAVGPQTVKEAAKFGMAAMLCRDGNHGGSAQIVVANYQRLHLFKAEDFAGVVCDESSILKNFDGTTKRDVTEFMRCLTYRLLCTATAAPNDFLELGTSSEALGYLGFQDMVTRFFKKVDKTNSRKDEHRGENYRFRGHSEIPFWRWVCSWARALRKPSDAGFDDAGFVLPPLDIREHVVIPDNPMEGFLIRLPAVGLKEQRAERRTSTTERCEMVAELMNAHGDPFVSWCHLNPEGELLSKLMPDAVEISGADPDDKKEEAFTAFAEGQIRGIITKPKIAGFGLNWQHCARQTFFPSHSYEQWHQCVSRSRRFGQKKRVIVDVISSEGESGVLQNLQRKQDKAEQMFARLVELMNNPNSVTENRNHNQTTKLPPCLQ
jgi:hypothetical protein